MRLQSNRSRNVNAGTWSKVKTSRWSEALGDPNSLPKHVHSSTWYDVGTA